MKKKDRAETLSSNRDLSPIQRQGAPARVVRVSLVVVKFMFIP